jgi:curved DNA-binding protein CbpA
MSTTPTPDYYKVLQVDPLAEEEVIEAAYRRLARKYHPDVYAGPDASERMRELNRAYSVIGNEAKRRAYDNARQREIARQALAAQVQTSLTRTSGRQRAVSAADFVPRTTTTGRQRVVSAADLAQHGAAPAGKAEQHRAREMSMHYMHSKIPSVRVSTGNWPAITPTTGKLPVTPTFVYRRPLSSTVFEELRNLGQGILVGSLGYPMAVAVCWFPLQDLWAHLGLNQHQALILTLVLLLPLMLVFSWWLGRRIRRDKF